MQIELRGGVASSGDVSVYLDGRIICNRRGTRIIKDGAAVRIDTDPTGIDKVYFGMLDGRLLISSRFRDFSPCGISEKHLMVQAQLGFVPYPFTIFNGVRKAPPGLLTVYMPGTRPRYYPSRLEMFSGRRMANLREEFVRILKHESPRRMISEFSGGFDSLLLSYIIPPRLFMHYRQEDVDPGAYRWICDSAWLFVDDNERFDEGDVRRYFSFVDEPSCDSAGFAEYLMIRKLAGSSDADGLPVMNGQGADGLYQTDRMYLKTLITSILPERLRRRLGIPGMCERFLAALPALDHETMDMIKAYSSIENDVPARLSALVVMLKYSLHGIEKIRVAARAFDRKYYLPFMSEEMIRLAYSVPSSRKAGYPIGKRKLRQAFPELRNYSREAFSPDGLKKRLAGENGKEAYHRYFLRRWIESMEVSG